MKKELYQFSCIFIISSLLLYSCGTSQRRLTSQQNRQMMFEGGIDSVSYAFGVLNGKTFKSYMEKIDSTFNKKVVLQGFSDAVYGLSNDKYKDADSLYNEWLKHKEKIKLKELQTINQEALNNHKSLPGVKTTKDGLQYRILRRSNGSRPSIQDTVVVDYIGKLIDGTIFDSSYKRGEPAVIPLSEAIAGWREGLSLMQVGSKYELMIPSSLAYGKEGAGKIIPPYSTLVFEIELKSIKPFHPQLIDSTSTKFDKRKISTTKIK